MKTTLLILLTLSVAAFAADGKKKVGHRISGRYPDKSFQEKIRPNGSPSPTPAHPYYPYGFTMPTHPPRVCDADPERRWPIW